MKKTFTHPRVMFHLAPSSSPNPDLLSTHPLIHCEDSRRDGTSTEFHSSTGFDPKRIQLNRILVNPQNQIIDDQDDIEEIDVKPVSYSQSQIRNIHEMGEMKESSLITSRQILCTKN